MASRLALVLAAWIVVAPASAQDDARTLFQRGQTAYTQGDYDTAIEQWTRAYELDPRPLMQFNLSQAYERLGQLDQAIAALERYLETATPDDPNQADARARASALRERMGRTSVRIVGGPEGATILIDGQDRGRTPRPDPLAVTPGSHRIIVRAPGYADFTSSIAVPAGQSVEVSVEMRAGASGGGEAPILPILLFSTGGAAVIAGAILGGVALGEAESAPGRESPQADSARALALGADITIGVGIAAAAAGLIVLLVSDGGSSERAGVELSPWADGTGAGLAATGAF